MTANLAQSSRAAQVAALLLLCLAGCARENLPELTAEQVVERSAESMQALAGFSFSIDRQGASAYLDSDRSLSFRRAEGSFVAPDTAQAQVRIIGPGLVVEVEVISIGEQQWETNPLSGEWQAVPPGAGLNPADLLDPSSGLSQVLMEELTALQMNGTGEIEQLPGVALYHLQASMPGRPLAELSFGLISDEQPQLELWIEPETFHLHRLQIQEYAGNGELERNWTIDFWDFGQVEHIEPPLP